jgi:hypothetical protein
MPPLISLSPSFSACGRMAPIVFHSVRERDYGANRGFTLHVAPGWQHGLASPCAHGKRADMHRASRYATSMPSTGIRRKERRRGSGRSTGNSRPCAMSFVVGAAARVVAGYPGIAASVAGIAVSLQFNGRTWRRDTSDTGVNACANRHVFLGAHFRPWAGTGNLRIGGV